MFCCVSTSPIDEKVTSSSSNNSEQVVTPWDVQGEVIDGKTVAIDYNRLIAKFGCQAIRTELIERLERLTNKPAHFLLKRGIFFSHRDLDKMLDLYEQKKPFYLYTGRGPSSESMHLGHMIPFVFCKYLQDTFDCNLVIQLTDDEKFFWKDLTLEQTTKYAYENAKDIMAVGFNPEKTFIFANSEYYGQMLETIFKIQKCINYNQASSVFGFNETSSIGKIAYPIAQIAPAFPSAFPHIFGKHHAGNKLKDIGCLIPAAIDQDPYFRLSRDVASKLGFLKPASIYSIFLPALQGSDTKMSASQENTAIYMTDSPAKIKNKINKYAFSGGKDTLEDHRKFGGNPDIDISFQYLKYFLEDDSKLEQIRTDYKSGKLLSGELKSICISTIQQFVLEFQQKRQSITPDFISKFMNFSSLKNN